MCERGLWPHLWAKLETERERGSGLGGAKKKEKNGLSAQNQEWIFINFFNYDYIAVLMVQFIGKLLIVV